MGRKLKRRIRIKEQHEILKFKALRGKLKYFRISLQRRKKNQNHLTDFCEIFATIHSYFGVVFKVLNDQTSKVEMRAFLLNC